MESMDFRSLSRKRLQSLCKKHGIPANKKNSYMATALESLFKEVEHNKESSNCYITESNETLQRSEEEQTLNSNALAFPNTDDDLSSQNISCKEDLGRSKDDNDGVTSSLETIQINSHKDVQNRARQHYNLCSFKGHYNSEQIMHSNYIETRNFFGSCAKKEQVSKEDIKVSENEVDLMDTEQTKQEENISCKEDLEDNDRVTSSLETVQMKSVVACKEAQKHSNSSSSEGHHTCEETMHSTYIETQNLVEGDGTKELVSKEDIKVPEEAVDLMDTEQTKPEENIEIQSVVNSNGTKGLAPEENIEVSGNEVDFITSIEQSKPKEGIKMQSVLSGDVTKELASVENTKVLGNEGDCMMDVSPVTTNKTFNMDTEIAVEVTLGAVFEVTGKVNEEAKKSEEVLPHQLRISSSQSTEEEVYKTMSHTGIVTVDENMGCLYKDSIDRDKNSTTEAFSTEREVSDRDCLHETNLKAKSEEEEEEKQKEKEKEKESDTIQHTFTDSTNSCSLVQSESFSHPSLKKVNEYLNTVFDPSAMKTLEMLSSEQNRRRHSVCLNETDIFYHPSLQKVNENLNTVLDPSVTKTLEMPSSEQNRRRHSVCLNGTKNLSASLLKSGLQHIQHLIKRTDDVSSSEPKKQQAADEFKSAFPWMGTRLGRDQSRTSLPLIPPRGVKRDSSFFIPDKSSRNSEEISKTGVSKELEQVFLAHETLSDTHQEEVKWVNASETRSSMQHLKEKSITKSSRFKDEYKKSPFRQRTCVMDNFIRASNIRAEILAARRGMSRSQNETEQRTEVGNTNDLSQLHDSVHKINLSTSGSLQALRHGLSEDQSNPGKDVPLLSSVAEIGKNTPTSTSEICLHNCNTNKKTNKVLPNIFKGCESKRLSLDDKFLKENIPPAKTHKNDDPPNFWGSDSRQLVNDSNSLIDFYPDDEDSGRATEQQKRRQELFKTPLKGRSKRKSLAEAWQLSAANRNKVFNIKRGIASDRES